MEAREKYLRFGIPSLDELFGDDRGRGLRIPSAVDAEEDGSGGTGSISICISGPDGTGKSLLCLHLAAHCAADRWRLERDPDKPKHVHGRPRVVYISTDLKFRMAEKVWLNFALNQPHHRIVPFRVRRTAANNIARPEVRLLPCSPLRAQGTSFDGSEEQGSLSDRLSLPADDERATVFFVDLTSSTTGDDWGFVNRVLSALEEPEEEEPRHVIIVDSVEGFETLVGSRDAYGLIRERRSRIAQVMKSASNKCHMLLVVEEPKEGERLPEEFVTDVVIRLRGTLVKNYVRRSVEIEKARGHSHVRGQHSYVIRSGKGSTTGNRQNVDDPRVDNPNSQRRAAGGDTREQVESGISPHQSYMHVCQSLHHNYRMRMAQGGKGRPAQLPRRLAAFGIRYLDQMLEKADDTQGYKRREEYGRKNGDDQRGLPCSTTTALIGNPETQKGPLGFAFLSRCFREYTDRFLEVILGLEGKPDDVHAILETADRTPTAEDEGSPPQDRTNIDSDCRIDESYTWIPANLARHREAHRRIRKCRVYTNQQEGNQLGHYVEKDDVGWKDPAKEPRVDKMIRAAAWKLGPPVHPKDGIPVLLTTQDVHAQRLALHFLPWLLRKAPKLKELDEKYPGCIAALRILMEEYTICRRLEIHDLPSAVLIHILRCAIEEAHDILHGDKKAERAGERAEQCWGIRVVIDDFSILKDTYVEISEEPLLLRFLVFYLGQEGVTTLLIDTQPGRPDATLASTLDSELRSLVDNRIYTWRFPFYGEDRVAIAVIPPISSDSPAGVRELRRGADRGTGSETLPLVVDPHFEMYNGIEKGEPQPIPLEIRLFEETPAFKTYIERENVGFNELFTPLQRAGDTPRVIISVGAGEHNQLRDLCYLQRNTRLDHTLVFQIDEFWMTNPLGIRRAGSYRPQLEYLDDVPTSAWADHKWQHEWAVDPFRLFQSTDLEADDTPRDDGKIHYHRRTDEFLCRDYDLNPSEWKSDDYLYIDRVPFMWDFGFLLCRARLWEGSKALLTFLERDKNERKRPSRETYKSVRDVWNDLPKATKEWAEPREGQAANRRPSWRTFLEACYQLAREQSYASSSAVIGFDLHISAPEALSCLILEVWASEIYKTKTDPNELMEISSRHWKPPAGRLQRDGIQGLISWLDQYKRQLFKAWLLLIEVLDIPGMAAAVNEGTIGRRETAASTIAVRHWYKTASRASQSFNLDDPIVPVGLPGHFSVRGDWFLAVAGGSRSWWLADRALDLLSSRRANYARLKQGLGLPTRRIVTRELRTSLTAWDRRSAALGEEANRKQNLPRRVSKVWYDYLLSIGGPRPDRSLDYQRATPESGEFNWLWRSSLADYNRHSVIWNEWLNQTILWWDHMRHLERDIWVNGFERYDQIVREEEEANKAPAEPLEDLLAWQHFEKSIDGLVLKLRQATPAPKGPSPKL